MAGTGPRSASPSNAAIDPRDAIRDKVLSLGFDVVGFAAAGDVDAGAGLANYLENGYHGDMGWLETTRERRATPNGLWPDARSIVVVGMNYGPAEDPLLLHGQPDRATVSTYARGRDYHDVLKKRLRVLARWMAENMDCEVKLFVDTAPVMEKPAAARAGLGWQGKHTNLVSREFGSWLFLGEVFTTLDLAPEVAGVDHCGGCNRCLTACPTDAFPAPYQLDARRCISYLTIEHKGHIPHEFRVPMGNRIYGCDDCLAVCPWNKFARSTDHAELRPHIHLTRPRLRDFAALDDAAFRAVFSGSPVKRLGRDRFIRNVLIAVGNSGDADLVPSAEALLGDPSPLVRAMAVWALGRLLDGDVLAALQEKVAGAETDEDVLAEWRAAIA